MKIYINNEEVVCSNILQITEEMLQTSSTILDNCYPKSWEENHDYTTQFYFPKDYSKCKIYKDDELIFCGLVKNTGDIELNPREPKYCSLQILDFKALLSEGDTLDFVIKNKTIPQAIAQIVDAVSTYGFVVGNIEILNPDDIIGAYSTLNKTAYDVLQYLAEISQSRWSTRMVDENTIAIDFYDPTLMPQGTTLEYTQQFFENNNIEDITFSYNTGDYRNKQIMLSDQVFGDIDYNENIISNGYESVYYTQSPIAVLKSIYVNGVECSFATKTEQEAGIEADFYYSYNSNELTTDNLYAPLTTIVVNYTPLIKGRQIIYNSVEVNRIANQINRNGVISRYENRNDVLSNEELQKVGENYIKYKGTAEILLKVKTNNTNLYNVGEIVEFEAPINDLKQQYMVKQKITTIYPLSNDIFYEFTLTSSYNSEQAINYFDNQRAKTEGNIASGDYITRNIDLESSANIVFNNLTINEIAYTGDNILNCGLNSPFVE